MMRNSTNYHTHISSEHRLLELNLREVWQYRDLILLFTRRNFTLTYKQTILGPAWLFLNPLISSMIYAFLFGGIAGLGTDGIPKVLFYLSSSAIWNFFAGCMTSNANTFAANAHLFGKVYFPRLTVPISNVLSALIRFGIQMLLVMGILLWHVFTGGVSPNWGAWLLLPGILLHLGLLGMGCGIIISSLTTKYRDLAVLVSFGTQLWMYATPIVYTLSDLGAEGMRRALLANPVTAPVELFRNAVLGQGAILPEYLALSWAVTAVVLILGVILFNRVEKTFLDTV